MLGAHMHPCSMRLIGIDRLACAAIVCAANKSSWAAAVALAVAAHMSLHQIYMVRLFLDSLAHVHVLTSVHSPGGALGGAGGRGAPGRVCCTRLRHSSCATVQPGHVPLGVARRPPGCDSPAVAGQHVWVHAGACCVSTTCACDHVTQAGFLTRSWTSACRRPHPQHGPLVVLLRRDLRPLPRLLLVRVPRPACIAAAPAHDAHTAHAHVAGPDHLYVDHVVQGAPARFRISFALAAHNDGPAQPFPCAADLALCASLVPLVIYELQQLPSLFVVCCALAVAFTMHPVLLELWVERYTGNANFVLATTIVNALAITSLVVRNPDACTA